MRGRIQPVLAAERSFKKPKALIVELTEEALEYLTQVRKLTPETLAAYRVGCTRKGAIAIPFFDEHGERQLVKFRHQTGGMLQLPQEDGPPKEVKTHIEKGGRPILLGSHLADPSAGPLVISFGDYDAMSIYQAGVPNSVSVPWGDGAFEWIKYQWNFIESFREIILFHDRDEYTTPEARSRAEIKREQLYQRLTKARCKVVVDEHGAKDANALLMQHGEVAVRSAIECARWVPEPDLIRVSDYVQPPFRPGIPTGYSEIDKVTGGVNDGDLIVVSGNNASGKTTVVLNILGKLVDRRVASLFWSGEQGPGKIQSWFERIACGPNFLREWTQPETGKTFYYPKDEYRPDIREWYGDHFYQYKNFSVSPEQFFEVAELAIRRYGVKVVVIDNLMAFTGGAGDGYFQAQGDFAQSCKAFAETWSVAIILIAHDKKVPAELRGSIRIPEKDDVEGSKKITNWADVVLQMYRIPDELRVDELAGTDGFISLSKVREGGRTGSIPIIVEHKSNRIIQLRDIQDYAGFKWEQKYAVPQTEEELVMI